MLWDIPRKLISFKLFPAIWTHSGRPHGKQKKNSRFLRFFQFLRLLRFFRFFRLLRFLRLEEGISSVISADIS